MLASRRHFDIVLVEEFGKLYEGDRKARHAIQNMEASVKFKEGWKS